MSFPVEPVQGFMWVNPIEPDDPRSETVCKILGRAGTDGMIRSSGPLFKVVFGDGVVMELPGDELHPWYPTE